MPYENVFSSILVTHMLLQIPTQKEINSGSSSAQVYVILSGYIYLILPKEKYHLGAIRNAKECFPSLHPATKKVFQLFTEPFHENKLFCDIMFQ